MNIVEKDLTFTWPEWKMKSFALSYDDANIADRKLVGIFNRYGLKGTFHIPSAWLITKPENRISESEIMELYKGHEISGHGANHLYLAKIAEENGHEVRFYDPYKYPEISLSDATNGSDLNIFTAPSSAAKDILPKLDKETPLICASKGFLSLKPFSDFKNFSAFGGAGFADEITAKNDEKEKCKNRLSPRC